MTKWEIIYIDFITRLPLTSQRHNVVLVVVDKLTKSAHVIPVRDTYEVSNVTPIFINEIIIFHEIHIKVISDRDS